MSVRRRRHTLIARTHLCRHTPSHAVTTSILAHSTHHTHIGYFRQILKSQHFHPFGARIVVSFGVDVGTDCAITLAPHDVCVVLHTRTTMHAVAQYRASSSSTIRRRNDFPSAKSTRTRNERSAHIRVRTHRQCSRTSHGHKNRTAEPSSQ